MAEARNDVLVSVIADVVRGYVDVRGYQFRLDVARQNVATQRVVLQRVEGVPEIRFFTPAEAATLGAFCDVVMAQDREPKIPVLNFVFRTSHAIPERLTIDSRWHSSQ